MISRIIAATVLGFSVVACAKSPESIAPTRISMDEYRPMDCSKLGQELVQVEQDLGAIFKQQRKARSNDILAVVLTGLPIASIAGRDKAWLVADLKGQHRAIMLTMNEKGCEPPEN